MSGAIMPDPLANPLRRTSTPSISAVAIAPFGKVSVVRIACAAAQRIRGTAANALPHSGTGRGSAGPRPRIEIGVAAEPSGDAAVTALLSGSAAPPSSVAPEPADSNNGIIHLHFSMRRSGPASGAWMAGSSPRLFGSVFVATRPHCLGTRVSV